MFGCKYKATKRNMIQIDTVIIGRTSFIETDYFVVSEPSKIINYDKRILQICDSLNNTLEATNHNDGLLITTLIQSSKYQPKSAYCGILVNEILTKAGIEHDVYEYGRANAWFKDVSKVIFVKGNWKTLDRDIKIGYVVGMSFDKNRDVSHVGIFIKDLGDFILLKTFEGNTSRNGDGKQQGIFYKQRKSNIIWIRAW